jgi:hypothetical protein
MQIDAYAGSELYGIKDSLWLGLLYGLIRDKGTQMKQEMNTGLYLPHYLWVVTTSP